PPKYSGLTKTGTALPRLALPYYLYCLRLCRLVLIFVNPLYCPFGRESLKKNFPARWPAA
ncbi:hypothetical protein, partial [Neisseria gonorrhoeae]|uniref:hypothetical protein n=1 Tax=Neisseria gonorrhoeae TaxID=485 RepID=UPI001C42F6D2